MKSHVRIGISGWTHAPWRKVFFPAGWPQKRELEFASRQVGTIEINGSFYGLQRPEIEAVTEKARQGWPAVDQRWKIGKK